MKRYTAAIAFALLLSGFGSRVMSQDLETELMEYFYPYGEYTYVKSPEEAKTFASYKLLDGGILKETHKWLYNGEIVTISENVHKLSIEAITDETRLAIVSSQQIYRSAMGNRHSEDKIFLFVRPSDTSMTLWVEGEDGDKKICMAYFTDISFWRNGEKLYRKAVKISKVTYLEDGKLIDEWSYWVKGLSKLATYGYWGDPNQTSCIERSLKIDNKPIIEINKKKQ